MQDVQEFEIEFVKQVTFRDCQGSILADFSPGDRYRATHDNGVYFVTPLGGIYKDEARKVE